MLARRPARNLPCPIAGDDSPARGPTSPLERNPQLPQGWKKRESDGVGLSILIKLGKARSRGEEAIGSSRAAAVDWAGRRVYNANPSAAGEDFQVPDFLSCCYLCKKMLHGKDIYMYKGEKAFCSMECRYQQIVSEDQCMESPRSEVIRLPDLSSSPCSGGGAGGQAR